MKKIIMVKFGGAILTDKHTPCTVQQRVIEDLASQTADYLLNYSSGILIGNGGGAFGHYFAKKYDLDNGFTTETGLLGMCMGKNGNAYLNVKLIESLLNHKVAACSYAIDDVFGEIAEAHREDSFSEWMRLFAYLDCGITPVVYGDIIYNRENGCRIISTEQIFLTLARVLAHDPDRKYQLEKIIFCTDRDGVEDSEGNLIPYINRKNFCAWDIFQHDLDRYDVTGGMYSKVKMSMDKDIHCPVQIINGNRSGSLYLALCGDLQQGTLIYE